MHLQEYIDSGDLVFSAMAERMMLKYNKYFGDLNNNDKVNLMMFVAIVLDPWTKLVSLEYWFKDVLGTKKCDEMMTKLRSCFNKLYDHYNVGQCSSQVQHGCELSQGSSIKIEETESANLYFMNRFHKYLTSKSDIESKLEINRYLKEDVEKVNANFDILNWWKVNSTKFSILAKIARDVLAIPITTIVSKSAFSTGGRVLDPFWSSLASVTVEALICSQNWLRAKPLSSDSDMIDDTKSYKLKLGKLFDQFSLLLNLFCYLQILFNGFNWDCNFFIHSLQK